MRKESARVLERNLPVVEQMRRIKAEHPFWGYRRTWAYLHFVQKMDINKKRVLRLMGRYDLLVKPNQKIKANRTPQRSKPRPDRPNQWWGIDMTKVLIGCFGWVYITLVLDWYTKKIVGYHCGPTATGVEHCDSWTAGRTQATKRRRESSNCFRHPGGQCGRGRERPAKQHGEPCRY